MKKYTKYLPLLPFIPLNVDNYLRILGAPPLLPNATDELLAFRVIIGLLSTAVCVGFFYQDIFQCNK